MRSASAGPFDPAGYGGGGSGDDSLAGPADLVDDERPRPPMVGAAVVEGALLPADARPQDRFYVLAPGRLRERDERLVGGDLGCSSFANRPGSPHRPCPRPAVPSSERTRLPIAFDREARPVAGLDLKDGVGDQPGADRASKDLEPTVSAIATTARSQAA
jgi:hypothetical protein